MHTWTLPFTAVVRNSAPLPCIGAQYLCSATMLGWSAPLLLGWSSPVFTSRVSDLCRVHVDVRLSHPRPSVVTAPVYRGCPCRDGWSSLQGETRSKRQHVLCLLVRRTRCRVVSVECSVRLLDSLSHPSSTWLRLWPCRSSGKPRTTCGSLCSLSRLISIRLPAGPSAHELLCMSRSCRR